MTLYEQLYKLSLPFLEAYHTDLGHDKDWIENNPKVPFVHYTRTMGTHLIALIPPNAYPPEGVKVKYLFGTADRDKILEEKLAIHAWFENPVNNSLKLILYYNGHTLKRVTLNDAPTVLENYIRRIKMQ